MHRRRFRYLLPLLFLASLGLGVASAQTQDASGNNLLKGAFRFRHVAVQDVDSNYNPTEITASYGTITFDGGGAYTVTGFSVDNTVSAGAPQPLTASGTYAVGANGIGYVANPLVPSDPSLNINGAVSQGIFTGSSTESEQEGYILNDIFIAIPAGAALTNATFTTTYQAGLLDFTAAGSTAIKNALFNLAPDGKGGLGTVTLNGQAANQSATTLTQTITGATYNFNSDGSATLTLPLPTGVTSANALLTGTRTVFVSADGNFVLGWTTNGYDIIFGVKGLTTAASNSQTAGLYFTAALEDSPFNLGTDSYYGSNSDTGNTAGDAVIHQRVNLSGATSFDFGDADQIVVKSDGSTGVNQNNYQYIFGANGNAFVGIGTDGNFALIAGTHAATFTGSGVFLNPIGVNNAASFQPITASIAPGELLVLYGTGLASSSIVTPGANGFPQTLGGVSVTINNIPCPIYYVTPTQLSVVVPYGVATNPTGLANIQVTNNNVKSNVVQMYLTDAEPGSFSQTANGIGLAAARHALTGLLITPSNPAQAGEYISLYLTGLGPVTPTISDGAVGPSNPLSYADVLNAGNLAVSFFSTGGFAQAGSIQFAGLTPTLGGLYQINVLVPNGMSGQSVNVSFITDAATMSQIQIPYGTPTGAAVSAGPAALAVRAKTMRAHRARARR